MTSAEAGQNLVMTWSQARRFLDARFIEVRERAIQQSKDSVALMIFLQVLNRKWAAAVRKLAQARLPQKPRRHEYRAIKTVNRKVGSREKVRPRDSKVHLAAHPPKKRRVTKPRKRKRPGRSHHKGEYDPLITVRGRPRNTPEQNARARERRNRKRRARYRKLRGA